MNYSERARVFWNIFVCIILSPFSTIITITIRGDVPWNCVTNHFIGEQILLNSGISMVHAKQKTNILWEDETVLECGLLGQGQLKRITKAI